MCNFAQKRPLPSYSSYPNSTTSDTKITDQVPTIELANINITSELKKKMQTIEPKWSLQLKNGRISILGLKDQFQILSEASTHPNFTAAEKLEFETNKLHIMQALQDHIEIHYSKNKVLAPKPTPKKSSPWMYFLFWVVIILEIIPMTIGGFLGINEMLSLIPGILDVVNYTISIVMSLIECLLFYVVVGPLLKAGLGIVDTNEAGLLETNEKQFQLAENINLLLTNEVRCTDKMNLIDHKHYIVLAKNFNENIAKIKTEVFKETYVKKAFRYMLSWLNTFLIIGGGYFMTNALLGVVAASLIGTPIGWVITAFAIVGQLVVRFAIRSNGLFEMLNPSAKLNAELTVKLNRFSDNLNEQNDELDTVYKKRQTLTKAFTPQNNNDSNITQHFGALPSPANVGSPVLALQPR